MVFFTQPAPQNLTSGIPASVGGWVTNFAIDNMPVNTALTMDNFYPDKSRVLMRRGYEKFAYGLGGQVNTLMRYYSSSDEQLLACANGNIVDISDGGDMSAETPLLTGQTSDEWQYLNYKDRIFAVNGVDDPITYDGSTIAASNWTGITDDKALININVYTERLFFVEKDSSKFWYATVGAVTGALTSFDLTQITRKGGKLLAIGTLSVDGGDGLDDYIAFIMSSGEVLIYKGTDPSDAAKWALSGKYAIPEPIGYRCIANYAGDLVVITNDGFIPLKQFIVSDLARYDVSLSNNISNAVQTNANQTKTNFGWQAILFPRKSWLIFNAPQTSGEFYQYIMNTTTGAWARFKNINAKCFEIFEQEMFFGDNNGNVFEIENGNSDNGSNITAIYEPAYNYLESRAILKQFCLLRPLLQVKGTIPINIGVSVDYNKKNIEFITGTVTSNGTPWGSPWGSPWSPTLSSTTDWYSLSTPLGYACSVQIKVDAKVEDFIVNSFDIKFKQGAGL